MGRSPGITMTITVVAEATAMVLILQMVPVIQGKAESIPLTRRFLSPVEH